MDFDPVTSPLGIALLIVALIVIVKAAKAIIKVAMLVVIAAAVYLSFFAGDGAAALGSGLS